MIKISNYHEILKASLLIALTVPIYAYLSFYFVYPVICIIPLSTFGTALGLYLLYAFLIGFGVGMVADTLQLGFAVIFLSSMLGYIMGIIYQGFPAFLYGYSIYLSDIIIFQYIATSWLILMIFFLFGLPGLLIGGVIADRYDVD